MSPLEFAPIYIVVRFVYRVFDFFHHWYVDGTRAFLRFAMRALQNLNRTFAIFVTLKHFFEPLYKDYSIPGRVWGVVFRAGRVFLGVFFTACFGTIFILAYALWALLPVLAVFFSLHNIALGTLLVEGFRFFSLFIVSVATIFLKLFLHGY